MGNRINFKQSIKDNMGIIIAVLVFILVLAAEGVYKYYQDYQESKIELSEDDEDWDDDDDWEEDDEEPDSDDEDWNDYDIEDDIDHD